MSDIYQDTKAPHGTLNLLGVVPDNKAGRKRIADIKRYATQFNVRIKQTNQNHRWYIRINPGSDLDCYRVYAYPARQGYGTLHVYPINEREELKKLRRAF